MFHREHGPPHFHAQYGRQYAVFSLEPIEIIRGGLPPRARRLVIEWAEAHRLELLEDWQLATEKQALKPISPLE
jgi:hypothetical protein